MALSWLMHLPLHRPGCPGSIEVVIDSCSITVSVACLAKKLRSIILYLLLPTTKVLLYEAPLGCAL